MSRTLFGRLKHRQAANAGGNQRAGLVLTDPGGRQTVVPLSGDSGQVLTGDGSWGTVGGGALLGTLLTADPSSPADDTWWVVREGTSPTQQVSLKARIGGVTVVIASVTR